MQAVVVSERETWCLFYYEDGGQRRVHDYFALMPYTPVSLLMQEYSFYRPAMNMSAMCPSGNAGILTAKIWLDCGVADGGRRGKYRAVRCVPALPEGQLRISNERSCGGVRTVTRYSRQAYTNVLGGIMSHDVYHATSVDPDPHTQLEACVRHSNKQVLTPAQLDT